MAAGLQAHLCCLCRCRSCCCRLTNRGKHFNASARIHGPQRSVDSLTVMQLWEVKNEAGNRALHSKLISSLFEKAPALAVQVSAWQDRRLCTGTGLGPYHSSSALHDVHPDSAFVPLPCRCTVCMQAASVANTPLVSQAVSSPMVARSLLADPVEREALLALPYSRSPKTKGGLEMGPHLGTHATPDNGWLRQVASLSSCGHGVLLLAGGASKPAAGIPGTGTAADGAGGSSNSPRLAAAGSSTLHPSSSISSAACTVASTPAGARASTIGRPFQGVVAALPEAAGLPYDEQYTYLCLLRRSVLYGPTMGLPTAPQAAGGGRSSMISLTGAASGQPCMLSSSSSVVFRM